MIGREAIGLIISWWFKDSQSEQKSWLGAQPIGRIKDLRG
jgi:hypothetical protein